MGYFFTEFFVRLIKPRCSAERGCVTFSTCNCGLDFGLELFALTVFMVRARDLLHGSRFSWFPGLSGWLVTLKVGNMLVPVLLGKLKLVAFTKGSLLSKETRDSFAGGHISMFFMDPKNATLFT